MCNVAGIPLDVTIADATEEQLDKIIAINQKGVFYGCQAAVRVMTPQGSGAIINVASSGIDAPAKNYGLYAMTKAAVAMLTKSLAVEVGRFGIRVNAIAPGATITPFTERHLVGPDGKVNEEYYDRVRRGDEEAVAARHRRRSRGPGLPDPVPDLRRGEVLHGRDLARERGPDVQLVSCPARSPTAVSIARWKVGYA